MKKYVVLLLRKYVSLIIIFICIGFFIFYFFSENPNNRFSLKAVKKIEIDVHQCLRTEVKTITNKNNIKNVLKYLNSLDYMDVSYPGSTNKRGCTIFVMKIKYYTKSIELTLTENRITFALLDFHGNLKKKTHCKVKNLDLDRIELFFKEY